LEYVEYVNRLGNTNHKEVKPCETNEEMAGPDLGVGKDQ